MRTILVLVRKDFTTFFRNKAAVSLTFIVPFALIWIFGGVFGINRKDTGPSGIPLAVVNASDNPAAAKLLAALQAEPAFKVITTTTAADKSSRSLREEDLAPLMRDNKFRFALVIPADVVSEQEFGLHLKIYSNPRNEIETQMVNGILQKTIFANVPQLLGQSLLARGRAFIGPDRQNSFNRGLADNIARSFGGSADEILKDLESGNFGFGEREGSSAGANAAGESLFTQAVHIESVQVAGQDVTSPAATRIVGGWAMQFLLFALSGAATALFYERDHGIFHRILAGPVGRSQILWSKFLFGVSVGVLQLTVLFVGGRMLYGIDVENHIGMLLLMCVFAASACTAFGMLIASLTSSPEAASGLATFVILVMCAVGGAWFPVTFMPEFFQQLSKLTLVYWAMEGFAQVLWANASFVELLPTLGILGGIALAVMGIAVWRFNRGNIFG
ncbi:MAG: linearmycin/streptolysin transport system permease protein [Verrucomicrobiota bacterium]|nr:linearmycin/streptolysin transport system permease protein [Verrucomicrobiota bacterium]